jgi:Rrf2 family protein
MLRLSHKADYAMRAALDLAQPRAADGLARTADVARRIRAPAKFLEAILGDLRRAGLVESRRGAAGGHRLAREAGRITAGDVWRAVEGPFLPGGRPARRAPSSDPSARTLRQLWGEVERAVAAVVDGTTLEELARRAHEAAQVQDFAI